MILKIKKRGILIGSLVAILAVGASLAVAIPLTLSKKEPKTVKSKNKLL